MEDIERLKKIGAREISKHTHMALNKIQNILDFNFEALQEYTTTIGLIKILEREYNVNLQKWQEEYSEFYNTHQEPKTENLESIINFKVTHEAIKQNSSTKYTILSAVLIIFLGIGFYSYTKLSNQATPIEDKLSQNNKTQTNSQSHLEIENNSTKDLGGTENNATTFEANINLANAQALPINNSLDSSASAPINELPQTTQNQIQDSTQTTPTNTTPTQKFEIIPRSNVWVGIVYLDTRKKTSLLTTNALEIDLTRPQTIVTGHGMIDLSKNGEVTNFNKAEKVFFMVDESGNFSEITPAEYNQRTRDLGW